MPVTALITGEAGVGEVGGSGGGEEDESTLLIWHISQDHRSVTALCLKSPPAILELQSKWCFCRNEEALLFLAFDVVLGCLLIGLTLQAVTHLTFSQTGTVDECLSFIRVLLALLQCAQTTETPPHPNSLAFYLSPFPWALWAMGLSKGMMVGGSKQWAVTFIMFGKSGAFIKNVYIPSSCCLIWFFYFFSHSLCSRTQEVEVGFAFSNICRHSIKTVAK